MTEPATTGPGTTGPEFTLLVRDGCHLCDDARATLRATVPGVAWREVDVDSDPELRADWGDLVPVLLVGEQCVGYWHLEPGRIRQALPGH